MKNNYKTQQRQDLLGYFKKNTNKYVSAIEVQHELKKENINTGLTTIYRFLNSMEKKGKIRYELKNHTKYYQYISDECSSHFHLQCKKCGKLIHLKCDEVENLKKHIYMEHEFEIDSNSPILGKCKNCKDIVKE